MKKLLLLLLLSLAFIGSANANSIKGAFGYKLGQIDKGTRNVIYEPIIYTFNNDGEVTNFELIPRSSESSKSHFPEINLSS